MTYKRAIEKQERFVNSYILPTATVILVLGIFQAGFHTFYFEQPFIERVGWIARDGNWPIQFAIGKHFFSDYLSMNQLSLTNDPWQVPGNIYPPLSMVLFKLFTIFPYKIGLVLWILFSVSCLVIPSIHATKNWSLSTRIQIIFILILTSAPAIGILDRGNCIFVLVPLIYFGFILLQRERFLLSGLSFGACIAIKLYPIIILIFLLLMKKWWVVIYSLIFFFSLTLLSATLWGNPIRITIRSLRAANTYDGIDPNGQPMLFSFVGILHNSFVFLGFSNSAMSDYMVGNSRVIGLFLLLVLLVLSLGINQFQASLLAVTTIQFVPTVSYTYTRTWTLIAIPLIISHFNNLGNESREKEKITQLWWATIISTNSLLSSYFFTPMSLAPTVSLICFLIIVVKLFNFNLILLGMKSLFSNTNHVLDIDFKSANSKTSKTKS